MTETGFKSDFNGVQIDEIVIFVYLPTPANIPENIWNDEKRIMKMMDIPIFRYHVRSVGGTNGHTSYYIY